MVTASQVSFLWSSAQMQLINDRTMLYLLTRKQLTKLNMGIFQVAQHTNIVTYQDIHNITLRFVA